MGLQMGHNYVHTFRILLRSSWKMCISPTCCIIEQKIICIAITLLLFAFLPFYLFSFFCLDKLCIHGGPQRTSDVLASRWKYSLIASLFFLSISLETMVLYLVDHPCVKLVYLFKDFLDIGSVSLLLSPSKSKDPVPIIIIVRIGEICCCSGPG